MPPRKPDYEVDQGTGCWVWQKVLHHGYGRKKVAGKHVAAHRWYYEQYKGPIPESLHVDHLCRRRSCVNPSHLEAVPKVINDQRRPSTKLSEADVAAIRRLHGEGTKQTQLAVMFGITQPTVSRVVSRQRWSNV